MLSREHARFHCESGAWTIEDLGGQNGTWVNGRRVKRKRVALSHGDVLCLGCSKGQVVSEVQYSFQLGPPLQQPSAPPPPTDVEPRAAPQPKEDAMDVDAAGDTAAEEPGEAAEAPGEAAEARQAASSADHTEGDLDGRTVGSETEEDEDEDKEEGAPALPPSAPSPRSLPCGTVDDLQLSQWDDF